MQSEYCAKAQSYLKTLCIDIPERPVGSLGNRQATAFFRDIIQQLSWEIETQKFAALDWQPGKANLHIEGQDFHVLGSPYAPGCQVTAPLTAVSTLDELENVNAQKNILLLHGGLAKEQLMPKNFDFYNPEEHQAIVKLLENCGASAIVTATGRNAALAGGVYPFPMIEDGDFVVPSVYMTEESGRELIDHVGKTATLVNQSQRQPAIGYNVIARRGDNQNTRIVITAHIDAKMGSPGALDNGSGVVVLLLLAELLHDYKGNPVLEIVAFNGEDYYAVPGQMVYIQKNEKKFDTIKLNINIDGAGYKSGGSAVSFFEVPGDMREKIDSALKKFDTLVEGEPWPQGDHSIFVQYSCPALAFTSQWFLENMDHQDITHTPKDHPDLIDCDRLAELSMALRAIIKKLADSEL